MPNSLQSAVSDCHYTKNAILMALKTSVGQRKVWVVVEAEEDVKLYGRFMEPQSVIVKNSEDEKHKKGYANVESIVADIKSVVPSSHIFGIRDADYTKYEAIEYVFPPHVFVTDRRDLEMMLLESSSVHTTLREWATMYDDALALCTPICRCLGYLRIFNMVRDLGCNFHGDLNVNKYWDYCKHTLKDNWEENIILEFINQVDGFCSKEQIQDFKEEKSLDCEDFYDICRGHDVLSLLSKALIHTNVYNEENITQKMIKSYSLDDFKSTRLYAKIKAWQESERVVALVA